MTTTWVGSPNFTPGRQGNKPSKIIIHWMDGNLASTDAVFQNTTRQTSAHYGLEDNTIHQYVKEADTAYQAGVWDVNLKSIGIEHSAAPGRPASDATYASSIQLCTEICQRWGISPDNIVPHNSVVATQCPGTIDLNRIKAGVKLKLGDDMADKIDVNLSRVIAHGILGRNGIVGRAYSLNGSAGDPWIGGELTAQFLMDVFNSKEASDWRDSQSPSSINDINTKLGQLASLQTENANLKAQLAEALKTSQGGLTPEQAAQLGETNSIVKKIWDKLTSLFK